MVCETPEVDFFSNISTSLSSCLGIEEVKVDEAVCEMVDKVLFTKNSPLSFIFANDDDSCAEEVE